jgi:cation transporter-like permease
MPSVLRVILARVIGALVAGLVAYFAGKGITIDKETIEAVITVMMTVFTILYGLIHTAINARINPHDVSSPTVAAIQTEKR